MNVFIVYTHPSKKSFTFQIFKSLVKGLKKSNHKIEISDLYEMNLRTDMSEEEYRREGFAYGYTNENAHIKKMKQVKLGLSICTAGHPIEFLEEIGISESMRNIMVDDRLGKRFERKQLIILGGTLELEKVRDQHIKKAFDIGKNIEEYSLAEQLS